MKKLLLLLKAASAVIKRFPKAADTYINGFPNAARDFRKKSEKYC